MRGGELWCVMGVFNAVLYPNERKGTTSSTNVEDMACFQNFVDDAGLIDLPLIGRKYT